MIDEIKISHRSEGKTEGVAAVVMQNWGLGFSALEKRCSRAFQHLETATDNFQREEGAIPLDAVVCRTMEGEGFRYTADRIEGKSVVYRKEREA